MDNLSEKIYVTDQEGVRTITLNRPEKKNAFDQSMYPMLASILEAAQNDENIEVF
jgi:enoyl-CoA hydratase/carnithine racemase